MSQLTIGQLAKLTRVSIVTIRHYEKYGLLPTSKRSPGGFRLYPADIGSRFIFIKNSQSVGFSLAEIKALLDLQQKSVSSAAVRKIAQQKLSEIEAKIEALRVMREVLGTWVSECDGKSAINQCPILKQLYQPDCATKVKETI